MSAMPVWVTFVLLPLLYIGAVAFPVWFMGRYPLFDDPLPSRRARRRRTPVTRP